MGKYGQFSPDGTEFLIDQLDTPAPWINYLSNGRYTALMSANAGGYSFYMCPKDGRITRWYYNSLPADRPGRYLYLRDQDDGRYWTVSWQPCAADLKCYRAAHGLGYTRLECRYGGIEAATTYFVPRDDDLEVWYTRLTNRSRRVRRLRVYPSVEWCLGHALIDLINKPNDQHFNRVHLDKRRQILSATKTYWVTASTSGAVQENKAWDRWAFMSSSLPITGFAADREAFVGPYRDASNPVAVERGRLDSTPLSAGNAVGVLEHRVRLRPGESIEFAVVVGVCAKDAFPGAASRLAKKYRDMGHVQRQLDTVKQYWRGYCGAAEVHTPSKALNRFINRWNPYQAKTTFILSRSASYYHWGVTRGMGFRDSAQDTLGPVIAEPGLVRERLLTLAAQQFSDGRCLHLFHPLSGEGEYTGHSDDPMWLIHATTMYLRETGDVSILKARAPYQDGGTGPLLEHLDRGLRLTLRRVGPRGIPTFGKGDWNDTLDFVGGTGQGESVWAGMFLVVALDCMAEIYGHIGQARRASALAKRRARLVRDLNRRCWDGQWYIRAMCADGRALGSRACKEGRIYLNPQTWSVISGVARGRRAQTAMDSVARHLDTAYGPKLLAPAYHEIDPNIGLITRCVWGKKENAAIFCHTVTWTVMAECLLGRGDRAMDLYERSLPGAIDADTCQIEPYVYAQYITSDEHEQFGRGSHAWLSGTAAWMWRVVLDYLLGLRPTLAGLVVDPCIPSRWRAYRLTRRFRGAEYHIHVRNPNRVCKGVRRVQVDGRSIRGTTLPILGASESCQVDVELG